METDYSKIPESDVIVDRIIERFNKGLNTNLYIIGLSGTGKSSTSIRLGELIDIEFKKNLKISIVDSLLELIRAIRNSKEGDIIIIEEVSVLFPSRRAMAADNVSIGKVLDTCRKKRLIIISNAPIWGSIDSHMRAMGHFLIETLRINKTQNVVVSKFHRLQTNPLSGKTYRHTLQRGGRDVSRMFTKMPSKEKWDSYEQQKDIFMDELYQRLENEQNIKQKKFDKQIVRDKPHLQELTPKESEVNRLVNEKGLTQNEAAKFMDVSAARVSVLMKNIFKKSKKRLTMKTT